MKYIEIGIGNRWAIRTETETEHGTEYEQKGIIGPINLESIYLRVWVGKTVIILDTKEGFKKMKKNRTEFKLVLGICSQ